MFKGNFLLDAAHMCNAYAVVENMHSVGKD